MFFIDAHLTFGSILKKQEDCSESQIKKKTYMGKFAAENRELKNQQEQLNSSVYDHDAKFIHNIVQGPNGCDIVLRDIVCIFYFPE